MIEQTSEVEELSHANKITYAMPDIEKMDSTKGKIAPFANYDHYELTPKDKIKPEESRQLATNIAIKLYEGLRTYGIFSHTYVGDDNKIILRVRKDDSEKIVEKINEIITGEPHKTIDSKPEGMAR